ncbi:MAG: hypothetical protein PHQ14_13635 [Chromatiales bacterium]|nr:hypothetical protein [Chromatiales bacterium]
MATIETSTPINSYSNTQALGNSGNTNRPSTPVEEEGRGSATTQNTADTATISNEAQERLRSEQTPTASQPDGVRGASESTDMGLTGSSSIA